MIKPPPSLSSIATDQHGLKVWLINIDEDEDRKDVDKVWD
jgi:hypothetical protein